MKDDIFFKKEEVQNILFQLIEKSKELKEAYLDIIKNKKFDFFLRHLLDNHLNTFHFLFFLRIGNLNPNYLLMYPHLLLVHLLP